MSPLVASRHFVKSTIAPSANDGMEKEKLSSSRVELSRDANHPSTECHILQSVGSTAEHTRREGASVPAIDRQRSYC